MHVAHSYDNEACQGVNLAKMSCPQWGIKTENELETQPLFTLAFKIDVCGDLLHTLSHSIGFNAIVMRNDVFYSHISE